MTYLTTNQFLRHNLRDHLHPKQHQLTAHCYREQMRQRLEDWRAIIGWKPAA